MASLLQDMARRACIRHKEGITDVGDIPYDLVAPILKRIENPDQLRTIEMNSPQIAGSNAELWRYFIRRDIQNWQTKILEPKTPESWWKVYRKLKREDNEEKEAAEAILRNALDKRKANKVQNSTKILHAVIPEYSKRPRIKGTSEDRGPPVGERALKNAKTKLDALTVIKRQSAHHSQIRGVTKSMPTHELPQKRSTVVEAPRSMVRQYARDAAGPIKRSTLQGPNSRTPAFVPVFEPKTRATSIRDQALNAAIATDKRERDRREERLRALTGTAAPKMSLVTDEVKKSSSMLATAQPYRTGNGSQYNLSKRPPMYGAGLQPKSATPASSPPATKSAAISAAKRSQPGDYRLFSPPRKATSLTTTPARQSPTAPNPSPNKSSSSAAAPPARTSTPVHNGMQRKRPAYNPMMPNKRART